MPSDHQFSSPPRSRRVWLLFGGIIAALIAALLSFLYLYDISPPDDADMLPEPLLPSDKVNPLQVFLTEWVKLPSRVDIRVANTLLEPTSDTASRMVFLEKHSPHLRAFEHLMQSDPALWHWPRPFTGGKDDFSSGDISVPLRVSQLLRLKILVEKTATPEKAARTSETLARFGHRLASMPGVTIQYLIGSSLLRIGEAKLEATLTEQTAAPDLLTEIQQGLTELEPSRADFKEFIRGEYAFSKRVCDSYMRREQMPSPAETRDEPGYPEPLARLLFKPNLTHAARLVHDRALIAALDRSWQDVLLAHRRSRQDFETIFASPFRLWVNPNTTGIFHTSLSLESFDGSLERAVSIVASHRMTLLQLALRRYELDHGHVPGQLYPLVPKYIASVPADPFTDLPVSWNAATQVLHCAGKDLTDDGGKFTQVASLAEKDFGVHYWWGESAAKLRREK